MEATAIIQFSDILVVDFCGERFVAFVYSAPVGRILQKFPGLTTEGALYQLGVFESQHWYSTMDVEELVGIVAYASALTLKILRFGA